MEYNWESQVMSTHFVLHQSHAVLHFSSCFRMCAIDRSYWLKLLKFDNYYKFIELANQMKLYHDFFIIKSTLIFILLRLKHLPKMNKEKKILRNVKLSWLYNKLIMIVKFLLNNLWINPETVYNFYLIFRALMFGFFCWFRTRHRIDRAFRFVNFEIKIREIEREQ